MDTNLDIQKQHMDMFIETTKILLSDYFDECTAEELKTLESLGSGLTKKSMLDAVDGVAYRLREMHRVCKVLADRRRLVS